MPGFPSPEMEFELGGWEPSENEGRRLVKRRSPGTSTPLRQSDRGLGYGVGKGDVSAVAKNERTCRIGEVAPAEDGWAAEENNPEDLRVKAGRRGVRVGDTGESADDWCR